MRKKDEEKRNEVKRREEKRKKKRNKMKRKILLCLENCFSFSMVHDFAFIINIFLMRIPMGKVCGVRFSMKIKHCRK